MNHILYQRLQRHAQQQPNATALRDPHGCLTYQQLLAAVNERMTMLTNSGLQRVALHQANSIQWVINDLALLFNNMVCIPVPPFFTAEQQRKLLADSGAEVVLTNLQNVPQWQALAPNSLPELPQGTVKITYTSGSTGQPKGVCLSAENIVKTVTALDDRLGQIRVQRHLCVMPLAVLLENIAGVYLGLWRGYEMVLADTDLQHVVANLRQYQPQSVIATPGLVSAIIQATEQGALNASSFGVIAVGGARLLPSIEQRAAELELPLFQGYGLSEFSSVACFNGPGNKAPVGSVGTALNHAQLTIEHGEIVLQGNTMLGYVHDRSSWYPKHIYTGDWGHIDPQGYVFVNGRKKNTIITPFARNVDPEWLEAELTSTPEIMQAAVFGGEDMPITALIVASQSAKSAAPVMNTSMQQQLSNAINQVNSRLPEYAHIRRWFSICEPFSVANQMLTGTGRNRRDSIANTYAHFLPTNNQPSPEPSATA
ncbi:AMP-binding protein [Pseudidiomarina woesei]|uniref:Long-chain acyl-CoA synthetase (AMP-forming) n=1 Tax=Pseudidiomarina woesei TaxID=1381080 RepID=A0A0K6H2L8_9GAMM|nr:AMP-binding protein [Pseudidiomarina woesei]CUA85232.1 Long-chain acyl-CoA synthetase (AMP-forming) [Pseudidiomarina woesei]